MGDNVFSVALIGMIMGVIGTGIGGFIGCFIKDTSNRTSSIFLELSAGIMTSVVCFDLLPEGFSFSGMKITLIGFCLGVVGLIIIENFIKRIQDKTKEKNSINSSMFRTGFLVFIGIMLHNFPEGLAIGSGFGVSIKMGLTLALIIAMHDVPEGIAITLPLRRAGVGFGKAVMLALVSGVPTGIGALIGAIVGGISEVTIAMSLGFAGGAMLYVVSGEIIPESKMLYRGRSSAIAYIFGFLAGIFVTSL